jgi:DNA-nicking Smr family endonuclease
MRKKPEMTEDEKAEFRQAMRGVKPLSHTKIVAPPVPTPKKRKQQEVEEEASFVLSDYEKLDPVSGDELIEFSRPGLQHKVLRNLRTGQYNVNAILDLHGMTVSDAKESLTHFLKACQERDIRHILIIHGKGRDTTKPILKNKLNLWLRQIEQVLAFCSATAKHGRGGALYVLLKGR